MYQSIQLISTVPSGTTFSNRSPLRRGLPRKQQLPRTQATWTIRGFLLLALTLALACFALSPQARAVCQQGCDIPKANTFLGDDALINNTTGSFNTANGASALFANTTGVANTANGVNALTSNTTGGSNTANGTNVLFNNTTGGNNTANGANALFNNTTGGSNTANGVNALRFNTTGNFNTANGLGAQAMHQDSER